MWQSVAAKLQKAKDHSTPEIGTVILDTYLCFRRRAMSADRRQAGRNGEREPRNVQVVILEAEHGVDYLSLWDDDGAFLEADLEIKHVGAKTERKPSLLLLSKDCKLPWIVH